MIAQDLSNGLMFRADDIDSEDKLIHQAERYDKRIAQAVRDFCRKNRKPHTLDSIGELPFKYVIFTQKLSDAIFGTKLEPGWKKFYKTYPGSPGIITIFLPGFSENGTIAVICLGCQVGFLTGRRNIHAHINSHIRKPLKS